MQETKYLLRQERLKEKLGKQESHYDMEEEDFVPVTAKQVEATENQKQLSEKQLRVDFSQTTTQAIRESSNALNKNLQPSIKERIQKYDEVTKRNNKVLFNLVK